MKLHGALSVAIFLSMLATPSAANRGEIHLAYCMGCVSWPSKAALQERNGAMMPPPAASILSSDAIAIAVATPRRKTQPRSSEIVDDDDEGWQQIIILSLILLGVAASTCSSSSTSAAKDSKYHQLSKEPIITVEELDIQLVETIDDDSVLTVSPRSPQFPTGLLEHALKLLSPTSSSESNISSSRDRDNIFRDVPKKSNDAASADDAPSIVEEDAMAPTSTVTKINDTEAADDNSVESMLGVSMLLKRIAFNKAFNKWETSRRVIFEGMSYDENEDKNESAPEEEEKGGPVCNFIEEQTTSLGYDPFGKNTDFKLPVQHQPVETFSRRMIFPELERYEYNF